MANRKKRKSGGDSNLTKLALTTAIISLINSLITLIIKLIEMLNK